MNTRIADGAGVAGAIFAALCCAGTPLIVGALAATGLGFLRKDALLWPLMLVSLAIALWGFRQGFTAHRDPVPAFLGSTGAASLAAGVIFVHGPPAMAMIYGGAIVLVIAVIRNILARRALKPRATQQLRVEGDDNRRE